MGLFKSKEEKEQIAAGTACDELLVLGRELKEFKRTTSDAVSGF